MLELQCGSTKFCQMPQIQPPALSSFIDLRPDCRIPPPHGHCNLGCPCLIWVASIPPPTSASALPPWQSSPLVFNLLLHTCCSSFSLVTATPWSTKLSHTDPSNPLGLANLPGPNLKMGPARSQPCLSAHCTPTSVI